MENLELDSKSFEDLDLDIELDSSLDLNNLSKDSKDFNFIRPWETLDEWQKEYIKEEGNCFLLCGRQVGKSSAMAIKCAECALKQKKGEDNLMIALTERQAYNLFFKTLNYLIAKYPNQIMKGRLKPTKHEINLKNGVKIVCVPTGLTGEGIRGYTMKKLFVDEGARISDEVFTAIIPMLSVTNGTIDIASTPCGKQKYFYKCSLRDDFKKFYVSSEDCPRVPKEFLENQKKVMSKLEYAQEHLALFLDELKRWFPDELIKKCAIARYNPEYDPSKTYYLGIDVARQGEDECRFCVLEKTPKKKLIQVENQLLKKVYLNEVYNKTLELDKKYNFRSIYIDDGGIGVGVFDYLLDNPQTRRKVVAINNNSRPLDRDESAKKKILKEDLYNNLLGLMERGEIELLNDDSLIESFKSVQYEYPDDEKSRTVLRIFGDYTHVVESVIRAAWAYRDKRNGIWVR